MFLCKVAYCRAHETSATRLSEADVHAKVRPGGAFDAVVGLTAQRGGALTYEETVVYQSEAAIPSYVIVYRLNDT